MERINLQILHTYSRAENNLTFGLNCANEMTEALHQRKLDEVDVVIDADAHLFERFTDYTPYMDRELEKVFEQNKRHRSAILSYCTPIPNIDKEGSGYTRINDPLTKLTEMKEWGIDYAVISPTPTMGINTVNNSWVANGMMTAYNSWIQDTFVDEFDTIKPLMVIASHEPDKAAEEIDRCADDFVGVQLNAPGLIPPLGHRMYDPIYEAAESNGLPIVQHATTGGFNYTFPTQYNWSQTWVETQTLSHPWHLMWNLTTSIYWGLPARFPDLDIVFQEAGIGWVSYMIGRLDDRYLPHGNQMPLLDKLPSEYVEEQYYFTSQPMEHFPENPKFTAWAVEMAGVGSMMYSSDLPHKSFDPPEELYQRIRTHFESEDVNMIMGKNAKRVFNIK